MSKRTIKSTIPIELKREIVNLYNTKDMSQSTISKILGIPSTTIWDFLQTEEYRAMSSVAKMLSDGEELRNSNRAGPKVLYFDVEIMASVALVFPRWKANISPEAVIDEPYMLSYAAAWGDGKVFSSKLTDHPDWEYNPKSDYSLICEIWELLDEADIVIAHNAKFDKGWFNQRCAFWGISPPSPYKLVCTLKEAKKAFNLPSNSLKAITKYFELTDKLDSGGMDTWTRVYYGDRTAFDDMEEYNRGDIPTLREVYKTVLPFMTTHPNHALYYEDDLERCYKCGSVYLEETGKYTYTGTSKFNLAKCTKCGSYNSQKTNLLSKDKRNNTYRGTV